MPRNLGRCGNRAQAHQRVGAGEAQQVDQFAQFGRRIAQDHAATGVDVGPLGLQQQLHGLADLAAMALLDRVVRAHLHRVGVVEGAVFSDTSLGMSTTTGPGRPVRAMWKAFFSVRPGRARP
jgi:hypothetical protein